MAKQKIPEPTTPTIKYDSSGYVTRDEFIEWKHKVEAMYKRMFQEAGDVKSGITKPTLVQKTS